MHLEFQLLLLLGDAALNALKSHHLLHVGLGILAFETQTQVQFLTILRFAGVPASAFKLVLQPLVLLKQEVFAPLQVADDVLKLPLLSVDVVVFHLPTSFLFFKVKDHLCSPLIRFFHLLLSLSQAYFVDVFIFLRLLVEITKLLFSLSPEHIVFILQSLAVVEQLIVLLLE